MTIVNEEAVEITDDGPIKQFTIPVLPDGGVVELLGYHGMGKTTALEAIESLLSKGGSISARDGAPRAEVSGFSVTLRRSNRLHRSGELEVTSLGGRFGVAELVDPGYDDPVAANRARIKALLQLTGYAKAEPTLFYGLVGGQEAFDQLVDKKALATEDLVVMAANVKSEFEKAARAMEDKRDGLLKKADASRAAAADIDLKAPHDSSALAKALETAIKEQQRLESESKAAVDAETRSKEAKEALQKITEGYKGMNLPDANSNLEAASISFESSDALVKALEAKLTAAKAERTLAESKQKAAEAAVKMAEEHDKAVAGFKTILSAEQPEPVSLGDLEASEAAVETARAADRLGEVVRKAIENVEAAKTAKKEALAFDKQAAFYREAAQGTDTVLSNAVQSLEGCPLSVVSGNLVLPTDRSPQEPFADLSRGEATYQAVAIAIKAVGPGGVFQIPQHFWEGLAESIKHDVAVQAEEAGVTIYTAKVTDDEELHAKQFEAFPLSSE